MPETARERVRWLARTFGGALAPHFFFCSFLLALHGCTVKRPQVPILDLTVSISVADDTTTIRDVAKRTEFLRIDSDGRLALDFTNEFDRSTEVGDNLQVTPERGAFHIPLGPLLIPGREIPLADISLSSLVGMEIPETDSAVQLAGADFQTEVGYALEDATSLTIERGGLDLSVHSRLPMPVSMRLILVDAGQGDLDLEEIDLGSIAPGGSAAASFDLGGKEISGSLAFRVAGATDEAEVQIQGEQALEISGFLRDLTVSEVTGLIRKRLWPAAVSLRLPTTESGLPGQRSGKGPSLSRSETVPRFP